MTSYNHTLSEYSKNMPILYRNILDGLPTRFAKGVFLWAVERPGEDAMCYRAERLAREANEFFSTFNEMLDLAAWSTLKNGGRLLDAAQTADLQHFIMVRWSNWRFGGNASFPASIMSEGV